MYWTGVTSPFEFPDSLLHLFAGPFVVAWKPGRQRANKEEGALRRELRLLTEAAKWGYLCPRGAVLVYCSHHGGSVQNFATGEAKLETRAVVHVKCQARQVFGVLLWPAGWAGLHKCMLQISKD